MMNEWIVSSSILIGLVLLGRWLLRGRISLRLQYALWGVVLLRLLVPVQLFSHDLSAGAIAQDVNISAPVRWVYTEVRSSGDQDAYDEAYQQILAEYEARNQTAAPDVIDKMAYNRVQQDRELDLTRLLFGAWFAGMAVMSGVIALCNVHFTRRLRRRRWELPVCDCMLPVYVTEAVPTPCIFGFFRPAIYLTPDAAKDDAVRRHVLHHELTHYRHLDHVWSVLRSVCLVLHWYNPLVWIAAKVSRADAELACDEGALKTLGEEARGDYARTLIGLTCADRAGSVLLAATTMTGSAGSIRERIRLLMKRPKNTVLTLTAALLLVTLAVGCTFAGAPETSQPAATAEPTEPAETTEPVETTEPAENTGHTPDNDMSYTGQELPIDDTPSSTPTLPAEDPRTVEIQAVLDEFFLAYQENNYLYTDHDYDHLTVLSADPKQTVTYEGQTVPLSDFRKNIEFLHDKESYWKHVRQDQGISRTSFSTSCRISQIDFDGGIAYALVSSGVTFTYTDAVGSSGMGGDYEVLLIQLDGKWLIADVLELYDWFDGQYKNNPDFDVEELIDSHIPAA